MNTQTTQATQKTNQFKQTGKKITKEEMVEMLKSDLAAQYSVENKDFFNMQLVLRAYGYDHTLEDGFAALELVLGKL